jgi:DNA-binding CsgD family transcriptional regulator
MGDDARPGFLGRRHAASNSDGEGTRIDASVSACDPQRTTGAPIGERLRAKEIRRLTMREVECLGWAAQGKSEWEISQILGISEHTAEKHLINARVKLGAVNRVHAVATALRRGVIR